MKVYLKEDQSLFRTILTDDTKPVSELIRPVGQLIGFNNATGIRLLHSRSHEDRGRQCNTVLLRLISVLILSTFPGSAVIPLVEVLSSDMSLREQGFCGEVYVGLCSIPVGAHGETDYAIYARVSSS